MNSWLHIVLFEMVATCTATPRQEHSAKRNVSGEINLMAYFIDKRKTRLCVRLIKVGAGSRDQAVCKSTNHSLALRTVKRETTR